MPSFAYTARDNTGAAINGTLAGGSIDEILSLLRKEGKFPTRVVPVLEGDSSANAPVRKIDPSRGIRVSRTHIIQFSTQLAVMLDAGVTIIDALQSISSQTRDAKMKALLEDVTTQVQSGIDLSVALQRHSRSFPILYIAIVRAAEKSGLLSKLLNRATGYLRDEAEIVRRVRGALTYPALMFTFAMGTTIFLLTFVLPKFTSIYAQKSATLPTPTRILMAISQGITGNWIVLLLGTIAAVAGTWIYVNTNKGKALWHRAQLDIPIVGPMLQKLHLARGLRMIGTMAGAGVPLVDAVAVTRDLCPNTRYQKLWETVAAQIKVGKQLSEPLFADKVVPRPIAQMLHSGERGGRLALVMEQVSTFSEQELKESIAEATRYIEPAMIIIMGGIIGSVTLALLMPIFTISRVIAH